MKIVKKIKLPIIFVLYLMICWHFGSAYILRDISFLPNDNNSIFIIVVYFGLIIAATLLAETKPERIITFIFSLIMLCWNIGSALQLCGINPLSTRLIEILAFFNAPNPYLAINYPADLHYFSYFRIANLLLALIPFLVFLFATLFLATKLIGSEKVRSNKMLMILTIVTCCTLKLSTLSAGFAVYAILSAAEFFCWIYTMYQYRNNRIITKIFFLFLCTVTFFYSIEIILFQLSGFGHLGNDYIGFYYNEFVLGPIILHYINLFPVFYDYSINIPEFICILILFFFSFFFFIHLGGRKTVTGKNLTEN